MPARNTPAKFWANVENTEPDNCWLWRRSTTPDGYGYVKYQRVGWLAHRLAYTLAIGPIPDDMLVRHTCDNPPCCNPAHLLLGSDQDNCDDKWRRNRAVVAKGVEQWKSKLTPNQVHEIRRLATSKSCREIGSMFAITHQNVRFIINRKTWKHI